MLSNIFQLPVLIVRLILVANHHLLIFPVMYIHVLNSFHTLSQIIQSNKLDITFFNMPFIHFRHVLSNLFVRIRRSYGGFSLIYTTTRECLVSIFDRNFSCQDTCTLCSTHVYSRLLYTNVENWRRKQE